MSAIVSDSERSLVYVNPIPDHARRVTIQVLGRLFKINHRVDVSLRNMTHGGASNESTKKIYYPLFRRSSLLKLVAQYLTTPVL